MKRHVAYLAAVVVCAVLTPIGSASAATTIKLHPVDRGWHQVTGLHSSTNDNYIVGAADDGDYRYRNWFQFSLTSVPPGGDEITAAKLVAANPQGSGSRAYEMHDVSTAAGELDVDRSVGDLTGQAIYTDLGTGTMLGFVTTSLGGPSPIVVPFNSAGLAYLNTARGSTTAVGGYYGDSGGHTIFDGSNDVPSDGVSLVLTLGPFSEMTLRAPGKVAPGTRARVTGKVESTPANPVCSEPRELLVSAGSRSFEMSTDTGGTFKFKVKIVRKTTVKVTFYGDADCAEVTEKAVIRTS